MAAAGVAGVTDRDATGFFIDISEDLGDTRLSEEAVSDCPALLFEPSGASAETLLVAAAFVTVGAAGFALRPHSQLVMVLAALCFSGA